MFSSTRPSLGSILFAAALAGASYANVQADSRALRGDAGIKAYRARRKRKLAVVKASRRANRNK